MKINRILLFILLLIVTGCVSTMLSSVPKNPKDFNKFEITGYSEEDGVKYTYNSSLMNNKISAWGKILPSSILITISNSDKSPIKFNYFMDSFGLLMKDDTVYELDKGEILSYPNGGIINPNEAKAFNIILSNSLHNKLIKDDVKAVICILFGETNIILKPLQNISAHN